MQHRIRLLVLLTLVGLISLGAAGSALAAPTTNAFGQTFAGQDRCVTCHSMPIFGEGLDVAPAYLESRHGAFMADVLANPELLIPGINSGLWPSPLGDGVGGLQFGPEDVWLQVGAPGRAKEYIAKYQGGDATNSLGQYIPAITPADDYPIFDPMGFSEEHMEWEGEGDAVGVAAYFQRCGGCHNLGLTRPANAEMTLPNGAVIGPDTPTEWAGLGIQCENCHGTGSTDSPHETTGVGVVGMPRILSSEVCGQCHVNAATTEKRLGSGSGFSNPNAYTTDQTLAEFITVYGYETPGKVYPSGHNQGMHHSYYNEWLLSGHADSRSVLKDAEGKAIAHASGECMSCHSAEGYMKANGYESSFFETYEPSVEGDTLDVECSVCHTVHNPTGEALGLRVERDEVCSQCHNGDIEEGGKLDPAAGVHHPQKEMLEGYGLIGVADTEPYMGYATCVDCHMPKTRAERVSHRMTPMLPGEAEEWGVQEEGDSCSSCHSLTRASLQNQINSWAGKIDAGIAGANAAITAAEDGLAESDAFGAALIAAAKGNVQFVDGDMSKGVHNPPYAVAGLKKAKEFAGLVGSALDLSLPATANPGDMVMAGGKLMDGSDAALSGQAIAIKVGGETVAQAKTDAAGAFSVHFAARKSGDYVAVWAPVPGGELASAPVTLNVQGVPMAHFGDVPMTHQFFAHIEGLYGAGIVDGIGNGLFGPEQLVKRAQIAKMVVGAMGMHDDSWTNWGTPTFKDVPMPAAQNEADRYPFDYVEEAKMNGVVKGVTADTFEPWANITRVQLALMVARAGGADLSAAPASPFTDVTGLSEEAQQAINWCKANSIIDGKTATTFDPYGSATRGHAAKMIWNLMQM